MAHKWSAMYRQSVYRNHVQTSDHFVKIILDLGRPSYNDPLLSGAHWLTLCPQMHLSIICQMQFQDTKHFDLLTYRLTDSSYEAFLASGIGTSPVSKAKHRVAVLRWPQTLPAKLASDIVPRFWWTWGRCPCKFKRQQVNGLSFLLEYHCSWTTNIL